MSEGAEIVAKVSASGPRRWFAIGVLWSLALLLIWVAFARPPAIGYQLFLIVFGGAVIWGAMRLKAATEMSIVLTEAGLFDSSGSEIAAMEDIVRVDRGAFAFKPSNGFLVVTSQKAPRSWHPGLWWRSGRRVGVGGVTAANETKFMAEQIAFRIAGRDAG